ncbi:MAG: hypothetical protein K6T85_08090, partial [Gorillibacterium sp.]|nr:hypothetical protein [Gorillibacterium sp.]
ISAFMYIFKRDYTLQSNNQIKQRYPSSAYLGLMLLPPFLTIKASHHWQGAFSPFMAASFFKTVLVTINEQFW